jgi:hypothetical protein
MAATLRRSRLHNLNTVGWLKKRHKESSHDYYLHCPQELIKLNDVKLLFDEFDEDKNGTLDLEEIYHMLQINNIEADPERLRKIFTLEEFRTLAF